MKKVFAFMSALLLTIACIGLLSTSPVKAASGLFTEDPTLAEDEIPVYIMDSIYTTFPNFYDNNAAADDKWPGTSRMYPWSEIRLRAAILDDSGTPTGKYYAVYFTGQLKHQENGSAVSGAGNNILFFDVDAEGNPKISRKDASGWASDGNAMDPSLSHIRTNISGQDLEFDPEVVYAVAVAQGQNLYNRAIIYDGQGRAIRGVGLDNYYYAPDNASYPGYGFEAEFCYAGGKLVKMDADTVCDKVSEAQLDAEGNPVLDAEGNPVMVETDKDNVFYSRFTWEWFAEKPANVNTVSYLDEGWRAGLWDYCWEQDGGYMCVAFHGAASNSAALTPTQTEVEAASAAAAGEEPVAKRTCVQFVRVPAGGIVYDLGYLDRDTVTPATSFFDLLNQGYKFGRQAIAEVRTYDFSSKGIYNVEKVKDSVSYQFKEGTTLMEIPNGVTIKPNDFFNYEGLGSGWITANDLTSYSKDLSSLDVTIYVNGAKVVSPSPWAYNDATVPAMMTDFFDDLRGWYAGTLTLDGVYELDTEGNQVLDEEGNPKLKVFAYSGGDGTYSAAALADTATFIAEYCGGVKDSWGLFNGGKDRTKTGFLNQPEIQDKWELLLNHMDAMMGGSFWSSAWTSNVRLRNYYTQDAAGNFTGPNAATLYPVTPKVATPEDYTFVADGGVNARYDVKYEVNNANNGKNDALTATFVVVNEYTPMIDVNEDALFIYPQIIDDKPFVAPIDKYSLFTAYDGKYCAQTQDMRGSVITEFADVQCPELNWDKPAEGKYLVTVTVKSTNGTRLVTKTFELEIADITAPVAYTRNVVLPYGSDFDCRMGVTVAYDNVDGDLLQSGVKWWSDNSKPVIDTKKAGTYTVKLAIYDSASNEANITYKVEVLEQGATLKALKDNTEELLGAIDGVTQEVVLVSDAVADVKADIAGVAGKVDEVAGKVEAAQTAVSGKVDKAVSDLNADITEAVEKIESVSTEVSSVLGFVTPEEGCKSKSAIFVEFLAAASLLVLVLKRKH